MNKLKLFIENFFIYGLGGVISRIIPLMMLPVITRIMPDAQYFGISDLSNTLVSFASAFAVLGMYDAMYRMFFEKEDLEYKKRVCSTALIFTIITSIIIFFLMLLLRDIIAEYFFGDSELLFLVNISAVAALVSATNNIISAPTRMQNKRKVYLFANTVGPILSYAVSIPLILKGHYLTAIPLSTVISGISIETAFAIMNKSWFELRLFDKRLLKQLLLIGLPLLPNFIIYWIFNSCDKLMIANILSLHASGIYSVGSKLGHISQLIYTAFAGGWQYFAFSTMKEKNQVESNSLVFEYLGVISFCAGLLMFVFAQPIFEIIFTGDYQKGSVVAPYLFMAPLLQMLFQVAGNQFLVIKKTWPNMLILSTGAAANILINYKLIPVLGIEGAAVATLMGYAVSDIVVAVVLHHMHLIVIRGRFLLAAGMTVFYIVLWRLLFQKYFLVSLLTAVIDILFIAYLYRFEIRFLTKGIKELISTK